MKNIMMILSAVLLAACTPEDKPSAEEPDKGTKETIERSFYAKGADISWATQMEADGVKFRNTEGQQDRCKMDTIGQRSELRNAAPYGQGRRHFRRSEHRRIQGILQRRVLGCQGNLS